MKTHWTVGLFMIMIAVSFRLGDCQTPKAADSKPCLIVDVQMDNTRLSFMVDGKPVKDEPLLDFLGKHRKEHADDACASLFVPREITIGDIGKIEATISKSQYSPIHVYCCSVNAPQVEEIVFSSPIPTARVRAIEKSAMRPTGSKSNH